MNKTMQITSKPQRLLREGLLSSADKYPDKTALVVEGKSYTFSELKTAALQMAAILKQRGVKRGDRVAIYMDNTWPCIVSIYGALLTGAVFMVVNPQTKREKLEFILKDSEAVALISDGHLAKQFLAVVDDIPQLKILIASGKLPAQIETKLKPEAFEALLAQTEPMETPEFVIPNDLAALIYTSGSTGFPKGVMQTHQAMVFAAWSLIEYLRLTADDRIMLMLPLAFDYGLYQLLMAMKLGATLVVERSFIFPSLVYKRIEEQQATVFPGVPTIFATLIEANKKSGLTFPSVTRVTNTAAALPADFLPQIEKIFPNALIYKMYGLTECKRVAYLEPELLHEKADSVGKAIPGTEVFLRSPEGKPVNPGGSGILYVRGPHIMAGYWKRPEQTAHMLKPGFIPGERILCTHDWFKMDEEGFLYFLGRSDDIIKTRGEKVSPKEVENVLHHIPGIQEAVVLGIPDASLGEAICAYVVADEDAGLNEKKVKMICNQKLENFMVPQTVIFIEKMPLSPNGKIDKKQLAARGTP